MKVDEAIKKLQKLSKDGYGETLIRSYTPMGNDPYKPIDFVFHKEEDNTDCYPCHYDNWIEIV